MNTPFLARVMHLAMLFDESTAEFPCVDCAEAYLKEILQAIETS